MKTTTLDLKRNQTTSHIGRSRARRSPDFSARSLRVGPVRILVASTAPAGACTIVVRWPGPTRSCLQLAIIVRRGARCSRSKVCATIPSWTCLRRHFSHTAHALQCGFCYAWHADHGARYPAAHQAARTPRPWRHELSGQICRCTGYAKHRQSDRGGRRGIQTGVHGTAKCRRRDNGVGRVGRRRCA